MSEADHETQLSGPSIGERLRVAREAKGLSLDEVASKTRIPVRHLEHIERGDWQALPAPTYSIGFARSYASAVGLDPGPIGAELREEIGGVRAATQLPAHYEPADPARVPPRSLAIVAGIIALLLIVGYAIWRSGAVDDSDVDQAEVASAEAPPPPQPVPPAPAQQQASPAIGPVVLTATEDVWLRVYEDNGPRLVERTLKAGERYEVPATAQAPQILTGRPNAIRVTVGNNEIPPLGPAERTISDVSLRAADLMARLQTGAPTSGAAPAQQPPTGR